MQLETAGRIEKVFRAVVSEARLIEKQGELLKEETVEVPLRRLGSHLIGKG
jgi:hypothetical protein